MKMLRSVLLISSLFILFGCTQNHDTDTSKQEGLTLTNTSTHSTTSQANNNKINHILSPFNELKTIKSLSTPDTILVAVEVKQFDRFQLPEIRKKLKNTLKKHYKEMEVFISTDQKVLIEIDDINEQINTDSLSSKEINKKIKDLLKLAKEET